METQIAEATEFDVVTEKIDSRVTEIQLYTKGGAPNGVARVWPRDGKFRWAHPNGTEGEAATFPLAVASIHGLH